MKYQKLLRTIPLVFLTFAFLLLFSACQSTNKDDVRLQTDALYAAEFEYQEQSNETNVFYYAIVSNDTIYNLESYSITVRLSYHGTEVTTETYVFEKTVKHGDSYASNHTFTIVGEVDSLTVLSYDCTFATFWKTYSIWIICTICAIAVASIAYIIAMFAVDFDLSDVFGNPTLVISILSIIFLLVFGLFFDNWVNALIVLGGILSFIILGLLAHLIQHFIN